jgi:ADP-heptose:LPS heptosyltransferase
VGQPSAPVVAVGKIAVLRANSLGDFLFSLPALEALRAAYPRAEIVLLGAPWHTSLLDGRPMPFDRVLVVPPLPGLRDAEPGETTDPEAFFAAAQRERFDLALQLHGGGRNTNPFVRRLGARLAAGLRADDAPPLDRWLRYVYYQPEAFRYLEVVALVGAEPLGFEPIFPLTDGDRTEAAEVAGEPVRPRVALHPGVTDARRRWPAERFAAVGDALAAAGCEVVLTGTPVEDEIVQSVRSGMRNEVRDLSGRLSLGGLAGLYADCAVVVANDTGPLHLAAAVGASTVGLYWVGNLINGAPPTRTRHRPLPSWTIHCPRCGRDCTRDIYPTRDGGYPIRDGDPVCAHTDSFVTDISVAEVVHEALDLLPARFPGHA